MKRSIRGCAAMLLSLMAIAGTGVVLIRSHFAALKEERQQAFERDDALDRSFNARTPVALDVRVMLSTAQGGYQVPAEKPSFRQHIASLGKLPAIIILGGCGFPVWGKDVPLNVAVLSVDENPSLMASKTGMEACLSKDRRATEQAFERQLDFLTKYVNKAAWVDRSRVMIAGYGEAAPVVAAYSGPAKQRLTLGDPCYVPWRGITSSSPLLMLLTDERQGLTVGDKSRTPLDVTAIAKGADPSLSHLLPEINPCVGLTRPEIPQSVKHIIAVGHLGIFERPGAIMDAQKAAYNGL